MHTCTGSVSMYKTQLSVYKQTNNYKFTRSDSEYIFIITGTLIHYSHSVVSGYARQIQPDYLSILKVSLWKNNHIKLNFPVPDSVHLFAVKTNVTITSRFKKGWW